MARVKVAKVRFITQYRDGEGHRLPSQTGSWRPIGAYVEADCPKCPEPEPVEAKVECGWYGWHIGKGGLGARFCPGCGVALTTEEA